MELTTNGNDRSAYSELVMAGNGDSVAFRVPEATEEDGLLFIQNTNCNGEVSSSNGALNERNLESASSPRKMSSLCRIPRRARLWVIIAFILLLIIAVIIISLLMCSMICEDPDENFDPSLFSVALYFNGSFQLPNLVFTEELFILSSNESQTLAADFQEKLAALYRSSPALGRYFSQAEIYAFRNGSVIADYQLKFLMPEEQQDELRNFTLSREMVYGVFRQFLYDQEPDESKLTYIDPVSLEMLYGHE